MSGRPYRWSHIVNLETIVYCIRTYASPINDCYRYRSTSIETVGINRKKCYGDTLKQCYNEKTCSIKFVLFKLSETKERWKESLKQCPCGSL